MVLIASGSIGINTMLDRSDRHSHLFVVNHIDDSLILSRAVIKTNTQDHQRASFESSGAVTPLEVGLLQSK